MYIDQSRCVTCFNCIDSCKQGGIKYTLCTKNTKVKSQTVKVEKTSENVIDKNSVSRRNVLSIISSVVVAGAVKAQQVHLDGGLADLEDKKVPTRNTPIVSPGAGSLRNMNKKCTACQLCVTSCSNQVLRPSSKLDRFMQPEMSFERGYCRPECVECSKVCPTGAITLITPAEKSALSIGTAHWIKDNCVALRDEVTCTICERHCPTGAVVLITRTEGSSVRTPVIDTSMCIGCGACENLCPARPFSAIYVEGNIVHHNI
jgi:ferredoxin